MLTSLHKFGSIIGFIFNKLFLISLTAFIVIMIPVLAITSTITNRDTVKDVLSKSNVYENIIDNFIDIVPANFDEEDTQDEPFLADSESAAEQITLRQLLEQNQLIDADALVSTLKQSLDPSFLQTSVESVLDSTYDFIDGTSDEFMFELTIRDRATRLSSDFKSFALSTLDSIPQCSFEQLALFEQDINILEAPCLPPGVEVEQQVDDFIAQLSGDDSIFTDVFTQEDLDISSVDLEVAETAYSLMQRLPLAFWIGFIGLAAASIMTAKTTYRGFKEVGMISFIVGFIMLVGLLFAPETNTIVDQALESAELSPAQQMGATNILAPLATELEATIRAPAIQLSAIVLLIGLVSFVAGIFLKRHHVDHLYMPHRMYHPGDVTPTKDHTETILDGDDTQVLDLEPPKKKKRKKLKSKAPAHNAAVSDIHPVKKSESPKSNDRADSN